MRAALIATVLYFNNVWLILTTLAVLGVAGPEVALYFVGSCAVGFLVHNLSRTGVVLREIETGRWATISGDIPPQELLGDDNG